VRVWIDLTNSPHVLVMRPVHGYVMAAVHAHKVDVGVIRGGERPDVMLLGVDLPVD